MSFLRALVISQVIFSSIPISDQYVGIKSVEELQKTYVFGRYHYTGCFSKQNMEFLKEDNFKGLFYPLIHITTMCFMSCKDYFSKLNDNKLHLIAIQHQLCFCIRLSKSQKQFEFNKTLETKCSLRSWGKKFGPGFNIGGSFEFALYCEHNNSCSPKLYTNGDETATEQQLQPTESSIEIKTDFVGNIINTNNFTTRFGAKGEFCMNEKKLTGQRTADEKMNNHEEYMDFVKRYVPGSKENPDLCVHYCKDKANNENISVSKYSALSTVSSLKLIKGGACYYCTEEIGLCHCIDDLNEYKSERFEKCDECSKSSNCTSLVESKLNTPYKIYEANTDTTPHFTHSSDVEVCNDTDRCTMTDDYGTEWSACPGERKKMKCPKLSTGWAYWECSDSKEFETPYPDFTNCATDELEEIKMQNSQEMLKNLKTLVLDKGNEGDNATYFGHEIQNISNLVEMAVRNISANATADERNNTIQNAVGLIGNLIANKSPWIHLNSTERSKIATNLTSSIENVLFSFAQENDGENNEAGFMASEPLTIHPIADDHEGFVVASFSWNGTKDIGRKFPQESQSSFIKILNVSDNQQDNIYLVSTLLNSTYLELQTPPHNNSYNEEAKSFNSDIISLTFSNKNISIPENGIEVKHRHTRAAVGQTPMDFRRRLHPGEQRKAVMGETYCMYWNTTTLLWSTDGCKKHEHRSNSHETICICSHLTAFAILTDFHNYVGKDKGLEIITLILCPASIFCLIATVICMKKIKVTNYERSTITQHFCVSLILGNLLLLLFVDREYFNLTDFGCTIVGIVTHYVFLCVLGWMAVQGHYLYGQLVQIFPGEDHVQRYKCFVYTLPLVLVGLTVSIGFGLQGMNLGDEPYGGNVVMYCWLNGHYIWAFMIPLAIVILGNVWMMVLMHKQVHRKRTSKLVTFKSSYSSNRKWLRGYFSLSVLLGLTWISGFFTLLDTPTFHFMAYVFTVLNASQGIFIFIFQCVLQEKVQQFFTKKYGKYFEMKKAQLNLHLHNKSPFSTRSISEDRETSEEIFDEKDGKPDNETIVPHFQEVDALLIENAILNNFIKENEKKNNAFSRKSVVRGGNGTENNVNKLGSKKFFVPWMQEMLQSKLFLRHKSMPAHNGRSSLAEK